MKKLFSIIVIFFLCQVVSSQETIARFKYEDAEKAFVAENYQECIDNLDEAEKLLGKTAPNILHLKILAQHRIFEQNPYKSYEALETLRNNCNTYLTNYDIAGLEEKYRDIYNILNALEIYPATKVEFEQKTIALDEEKQRELEGVITIVDSFSPMIFVEGGSFTMGGKTVLTNNSEPGHKVRVSSFYLGKFEVTQELWEYVSGSNPSKFPNCKDCPVENMAWEDTQVFIEKLNKISGRKYRLPTEAEWEFAAKGGNKSLGYTKVSGGKKRNKVAWNLSDVITSPQPVGKKDPNELGIYDMTGNVWEWVNDWYAADYYKVSPEENPKGPVSGKEHVRRGGGFRNEFNCDLVSRLAGDLLEFYAQPPKKIMGAYRNTGEKTIITGLRLAMDKE